ncbi:MAG: methyltransferase domain-containing protein [Bacteroidetes bacterium]|nr:MAG: methyltransferase domain-containing protein [Bacteroidota bacterium]
MGSLFLKIFYFFDGRKKLFYFTFSSILLVLIYFASKVELQESVAQMLPQDKATEKLNKFYQNSKISDRILFRLSAKDSTSVSDQDSLVFLCDKIIALIDSSAGEFIESIEYMAQDSTTNNMLSSIDENLPFFLEKDDYRLIDSITSTEAISAKVEANYKTLTGPAGMTMSKFIVKDPLGINFIAYKKLQNLKGDEDISLYDGHFFSHDNKYLLFFLSPKYSSSETSKNFIFSERLKSATSKAFEGSGYKLTYFGAPLVAAGNAAQIRKDIVLTSTLTIVLLILMVALFFRKWTYSILMIFPVIFGAAFALALVYFLKGEISVISIGAGSVVLGIAVNYSVHFLMHQRYHGNVKEAIKELAFPMTVGSLTTIGGFLSLQFVKAPVLQDLGLFAALCLIGAALSSLIFLPHFISKNTTVSEKVGTELSAYEKLMLSLQKNKKLALFFVLLTPVFFYFAKDVSFEDNMTKINYMSKELKEAETEMNNAGSFYHKSVFVVASGKSLDEALQRNEAALPEIIKMKKASILNSYTGVSSFIISEKEQSVRLERWSSYWSPEKRGQVLSDLVKAGEEWRFKSSAFKTFETFLEKKFEPLNNHGLGTLGNSIAGNFVEKNKEDYHVITLLKPAADRIPEVYSSLSAYPELTVFDRQFIVDNLVRIVGEDFNFIMIFSSLLVFFALLISYGRIELALISFIPMVISWIWILGIMSLLGIKFNIINIILSTLVFALGDDYCIFTMDGLQQEYAKRKKSLVSVRASILFSVATTIVGLGILIFAKHPALRSIAVVSIIGLAAVWLVSQTLQPMLFQALIKGPTEKNNPPYTLWGLMKSVFAFLYFVFGALLLTLIGLLFFKLNPFHGKRTKYTFHWILSNFMKSLIYIMANVKKRIINETGEDFSKPAVIIANHLSFLDILSLGMLNPKLIFLTNKWVWNSPVFGFVVRMADYYPVAEGAENSVDKLAQRVREGYSVVIFPEGTRSVDGVIKRFHKGAFFLAEQLQVDILPIVLHGTGYCMTKGQFLLKDSQITIKYLPRIGPKDTQFGAAYAERAKLMGRYFREEYRLLAEEIQQPKYYKTHIQSDFIYKGPVLEWYMKIKLHLENYYKIFNELIPKSGKILDLGCGYGFLSYMLAYLSPARIITGVDYDEDKIDIAKHGYSKGKNVNFLHKDVLDFDEDKYDAIVLSDVLHYLEPASQVKLLERCLENLSPDGVFVIRDGIKELKDRHKGTKLSELFSTRIFGFNKTQKSGLSFISSDLIENFAESHKMTVSRIDQSKFTSNIIFSLKRST